MQLKLVSFALCPFVHRTVTLLREKGVPYDIEFIDLKNKPEWFLKLSPLGKVPVLVADGTVLFESAIINEFIDETHAPAILPIDPFERARQRAWVEVSGELFGHQYRLSMAADEQGFADAEAKAQTVLTRLEDAIKGKYFAGDTLSLVDVAFAPALYRFSLMEKRRGVSFFQNHPKVQAWATHVLARPSVTSGLVPDFEERFNELFKDGWLARLVG